MELNDGEDIYPDILVNFDEFTIPIELKYKTKTLSNEKELILETEFDLFKLRNHSAQDVNRYLFLKDVSRLEKILELYKTGIGYAIFLTNEQGYWRQSHRDTIDEAFRLHEGRILEGELDWKKRAAPGTIKGNEKPIKLDGKYDVQWEDYSSFQNPSIIFKYLVIEVAKILS